jgi:4-amino-4-deoxy-L-arabinose transferase-like glycosyltransferase
VRHARATDFNAAADSAGPPLSPLSQSTRHLAGGWQYVLPVLIAVYLGVALTHAFRAPVGATGYQDAPDEDAHVTYVRVVAMGRLPSNDHPGVSVSDTHPSYEWHQPPLYYFLAARFLPLGVKGIRVLSVFIGVACILVIYRSARVVFSDRPETAVLAAGIAALIPGHSAITSVVNNDALLELCFSGYILLWFTTLNSGLTEVRSTMIGLVLGAALLTKATAVLLLPLTLLALALLLRNGARKSTVFRSALIIAGTAILVSGWWFIRNGMLYHEWLPMTAFRNSFAKTALANDVVSGRVTGLPVDSWMSYVSLVVQWTFKSFFAVYSTDKGAGFGVPKFLPGSLYQIVLLMACAVAGGLIVLWRQERTKFTSAQIYGLWILVVTLGLVSASFVAFTSRYFQAQGRYFYPAMLPVALLGALGWRALFPPQYKGTASILLLCLLFVFCLAFLLYAA